VAQPTVTASWILAPAPSTLAPLRASGSGKALLDTDGSGARRLHITGTHGWRATFECVGGGTASFAIGGNELNDVSCAQVASASLAADDAHYSIDVLVRASLRQHWRVVVRQAR
jgi:hypothetical protein